MFTWRFPVRLVWGAAILLILGGWLLPTNAQGEPVSFKNDVFPILELRCLSCHQPGGSGFEKSGLDMRTYESLMKGTKYGSMIVPKSAFTSNLIAVIDHRTDTKLYMPHNKKRISKCERLILRFWINQGAKNN
tara:strand:- start:4722 stop:5120 length:399 start_codon:yes stop_codon:yes gene_type:complete